MADSAASSTPRVTRPAAGRRRARAASPVSDAPVAPLGSEPDVPAPVATGDDGQGGGKGNEVVDAGQRLEDRQQTRDSHDELLPAERIGTDSLGAMDALHFDPRQGTLAGFELPADALDSLRSRAAAQRAAAETEGAPVPQALSAVTAQTSSAVQGQVSTREQVIPEPAGARIADIAAYLRVDDTGHATSGQSAAAEGSARSRLQPVKRPSTSAPVETPASLSSLPPPAAPASADSRGSHDAGRADAAGTAALAQGASTSALADTVAALSRALAEERRAAAASRRRTARLLAVMACASVLVLALAVAQFVVLARVARESAAAEQKTEALLRSQQLALAAFLDTASGAAADIRGTADVLAGRLAALPSRQGAAQAISSGPASTQPSLAKHARAARAHKGG